MRCRLFCESLLGPIEHGEGHYGGELMRSLEAFIECNGQWEAAARRLYCHRPYAALPNPQDRGAHRARPELGARPHRVLAGPARREIVARPSTHSEVHQ
jgi:hypothetical protein